MIRWVLQAWFLLADAESDDTIAARVQALEVASVATGSAAELSLIVLEAPDPDLPLALRIDAGAVTLTENRLGWSAVVDAQALQPRVRVPFTAPSTPGSYEVHATIDYSVCAPDWCRQKHGSVTWSIRVQ